MLRCGAKMDGTHSVPSAISENGIRPAERDTADMPTVNGENRPKKAPSAAQEARRKQARKKMQNWFSTPSIEMMDEEGGLAQPEFLEASKRKVEDNPLNLSCLVAVQELQSTGRFGEAQLQLENAVQLATGNRDQAVACLLLGELLNRWGAASPEYTVDIMEKAAEYSDRAVTLLNSVIEEDGDPSLDDMKLLRSAYFWKALNCGSVSGLGGCDKWSCNESMKQAEEALQAMVQLDANSSFSRCDSLQEDEEVNASEASPTTECTARENFVAGVLIWCRAHSIVGGHRPEEGREIRSYFEEALQLFLEAHAEYMAAFGLDNSETIKAITMIAASYRKLDNKTESLAWTEREVSVRERVHGSAIPRTQLARKTLNDLRGSMGIRLVGDADDASERSAGNVRPDELVWSLNPFELEDSWMVDALLQMCSSMGFFATFSIDERVMVKFIYAVRLLYHDQNSFHNWRHAWSATHCAYMILRDTTAGRLLDETHRLTVLLSVLVHDLDHPGVNSDFLIKSASPIAINYPTPNVLEHMHWDRATRLLEDGAETDVLGGLDREQKQRVLDLVFHGIMATDMQNHKALMQDLGERVDKQQAGEAPFDTANPEDMRALLKIVVHASDLSGQCMDPDVAYEFGKRVLEEFYNQAQKERAEQLPESVFMKNLHVPLSQAKAQLGFLHYVVSPLWKRMCQLFPELEPLAGRVEERATEIDFDDLSSWKGVNATLVEKGE